MLFSVSQTLPGGSSEKRPAQVRSPQALKDARPSENAASASSGDSRIPQGTIIYRPVGKIIKKKKNVKHFLRGFPISARSLLR
jgi:hypothetical protein